MRKLVCTIMILFTCFSESVVLATTVYPAVGGQWNYGVGITVVLRQEKGLIK